MPGWQREESPGTLYTARTTSTRTLRTITTPNCEHNSRDYIIHASIESGNVEHARWVLDNLDLMGGGVPHPFAAPVAAVRTGSIEMLEMLYERCDPRYRDRCILREAVRLDDVPITRWILGREIRGEVSTFSATEWFTKNPLNPTLFEWVCKYGKLDILKLLVEHDTVLPEATTGRESL
ncbi:hypothetical protein EX30DRAFT_371653 [Ascodesmis nigricans]|uniref:Ankyrin n=1 Tax=Ascodesmis nigricans TaxID=341454 RepID=A0A4S2MXE0_9PEZI|nr:hypothetical protein EX30DRAFT_371653 [Ascodesmis nigricans]